MRVAVVTGASSGIGREFVRQLEYFYKDLDEIWVIARREERLEQLRKEVNVPLRIFAGDLQKNLKPDAFSCSSIFLSSFIND